MTTTPLRGRVVILTGGARGIGYAAAKRLIELGAKVCIGDIDESRLLAAADELGIDVAARLDVTDPASFRGFYATVTDRLGTPYALVNNAGIVPVGPTVEEPDDVARRMVDINLHGVVTGTKLALESMLPRRSGHIINVASAAGEVFVPGAATYGATQAAVISFTEAVRLEHRASGVDVSLVLPTFTNIEPAARTTGPGGLRNAEPEEISEAIASLLQRPRPRAYVPKSRSGTNALRRPSRAHGLRKPRPEVLRATRSERKTS